MYTVKIRLKITTCTIIKWVVSNEVLFFSRHFICKYRKLRLESDKYNYRDCSLIDKQGLSLVADKLYPFKNSVLKWSFRGFIFLVETIIVMYT